MNGMRTGYVLGGLIALFLLVAGCGDAATTQPNATATFGVATSSAAVTTTGVTQATIAPTSALQITSAPTTAPMSPTPAPDPQQAAEAVVRRFVTAANSGDADGVAQTFAPTARFDSVGRIYQGRDDIMDRFLKPEVLALGGQYTILGVTHVAESVTVEFTFRAGSSVEHFTYRCVVRDGLIHDVVGRYVSTATPTPSPSVSSNPAQCYVTAVNANDLDGLVACFAPEGVVIDVSRRIVGSQNIRTWANNEVMGGHLEVRESSQIANGVRLLVHWSPKGSLGWNAYYTFTFTGGKIAQADLQYA